jgi:hypothetical protein
VPSVAHKEHTRKVGTHKEHLAGDEALGLKQRLSRLVLQPPRLQCVLMFVEYVQGEGG